MKLVVQRVIDAQVRVVDTDETVGKIGKGIFILIGVGKDDRKEDVKILAKKISKLRIISDIDGKMNLSIKDADSEILVVSQFTLHADTSGGNRPSFIKAAEPKYAQDLIDFFVHELRSDGLKVQTGKFGEYMQIDAKLDGPVTILY
jgi:D-tyrosyl-tRNA(Tyr) deacylase